MALVLVVVVASTASDDVSTHLPDPGVGHSVIVCSVNLLRKIEVELQT
jgi:hypothetical protein